MVSIWGLIFGIILLFIDVFEWNDEKIVDCIFFSFIGFKIWIYFRLIWFCFVLYKMKCKKWVFLIIEYIIELIVSYKFYFRYNVLEGMNNVLYFILCK